MNIYRYSVYLQYTYKGTPYIIDNKYINNIMIDYDYDKTNMPAIYIDAYIDKRMLDDIIKNSDTNKMLLMINKYIDNTTVKIEQTYIRGNFIYYTTDEVNYNNTLDYDNKSNSDSKDLYKKTTIGMVLDDLINHNKIVINDVIRDSNLFNIILHYTKQMKLLIEPVNNQKIDKIIIPPMNSISKLIEFLDRNFSIYKNNKYRLFYDFDKTYLLSSSGNPIQSIDEKYCSIIFKVQDTAEVGSKFQGLDTENNAYVIYVGSDNISPTSDKATSKVSDGTLTINSTGDYAVSSTGDKVKIDSSKLKIEKTYTDNLNSATVNQSQINNSTDAINIIKTDIDTSIFTINKLYNIENYPALSDKNGRYILAKKTEIYTPQNTEFMVTDLLTFRKVESK